MSLSAMFDSYVSGYRPAIGRDALEGVTQDFTPGDAGVTTLFTNVPCSYQSASVGTQLLYAQRSQQTNVTLLLASNPGDVENCLLVVKRLRLGDTVNLIVVGYRNPIQMGQTWVWPVDCLHPLQPA